VERSQYRVPELRPAAPIELEAVEPKDEPTDQPVGKEMPGPAQPKDNGDLGDSLYESYRPQLLRVKGSQRHPTPLVESAAMSAVKPPTPTYRPHLSPDLVAMKEITVTNPDGSTSKRQIGVSEAALENIVYAGQAHQQMLPAIEGQVAHRRGYFIGDGTGAGKGREVAGIITDNMNQGRKKHVWVSKNQNLMEDATRDWKDLGQHPDALFNFEQIRKGTKIPAEGIAFLTYGQLRSKPQKGKEGVPNIDKLVNWLGKDFDGVIAFDEAHSMSNGMDTEGERGMKKASKQALAGIALQQRLPNARVVYVSATGATEVSNLAYAERLGIWGPGTAFAGKQEFLNEMTNGGVAAMEAVAQSLKASGSYAARSLSMDDGTPNGKVTYDRLTHKLSEDQHKTYNGLADAWQVVLKNIAKALALTGGDKNKDAKSAAASQFWGGQQRFFNQILTSMQTPSLIGSIHEDLKAGRSPVVQMVNTMEASLKRALENQEEGAELEELDLSPREVLFNYLKESFPTQKHEETTDANGNTIHVPVTSIRHDPKTGQPVKNPKGEYIRDPVEDPAAVKLRDEMLTMVKSLSMPESPLDQIINHFGHESVSEVTGRSQRVIKGEDGKPVLEQRNSAAANEAETNSFQSGKKQILVFSDAGGTGRSYHADRNAKNQNKRTHYLLQPGWRADNAVQGIGRTHRTNQAIAPHVRLLEISDVPAQRRFISTIARRLDQLGALTRGQRQAGASGLFKASDNLESPEANRSIGTFFDRLKHGQVEGLEYRDVMGQLGLAIPEDEDDEGKRPKKSPVPPMKQFLNRMLCLTIPTQQKLFGEFDKILQATVEKAQAEGTLDTGVENFPAQEIIQKNDRTVYKDPSTGAEARHLIVTAKQATSKRKWAENEQGELPVGYYKNVRSGRVYAAYKSKENTDAITGKMIPQFVMRGPTGKHYRAQSEVDNSYTPGAKFQKLSPEDAKPIWETEFKDAPDSIDSEEHFLTGALLPIWNRIPGDKPKIFRLRTSDGKTMVGRHIQQSQVEQMLNNMGVSYDKEVPQTDDAHEKLSTGKATRVEMANGWYFIPVRVGSERRIELKGPSYHNTAELEGSGAFQERVNYNSRWFVPTGAEGVKVLQRIIDARNSPITKIYTPKADKYARNSLLNFAAFDRSVKRYARQHTLDDFAEFERDVVRRYARPVPCAA